MNIDDVKQIWGYACKSRWEQQQPAFEAIIEQARREEREAILALIDPGPNPSVSAVRGRPGQGCDG